MNDLHPIVPQVGMQIEQKQITARTRKLKARWSIQAQQDLSSWHGSGSYDDITISTNATTDEIEIIFKVYIEEDKTSESHTLVGKKTKRLEKWIEETIKNHNHEKVEGRVIWDILVDTYNCVLKGEKEVQQNDAPQSEMEIEMMDSMSKEISKEIDRELVKRISEEAKKQGAKKLWEQ